MDGWVGGWSVLIVGVDVTRLDASASGRSKYRQVRQVLVLAAGPIVNVSCEFPSDDLSEENSGMEAGAKWESCPRRTMRIGQR